MSNKTVARIVALSLAVLIVLMALGDGDCRPASRCVVIAPSAPMHMVTT